MRFGDRVLGQWREEIARITVEHRLKIGAGLHVILFLEKGGADAKHRRDAQGVVGIEGDEALIFGNGPVIVLGQEKRVADEKLRLFLQLAVGIIAQEIFESRSRQIGSLGKQISLAQIVLGLGGFHLLESLFRVGVIPFVQGDYALGVKERR